MSSQRVAPRVVPHRPRVNDVPNPRPAASAVARNIGEAFELYLAKKQPVVTPPPLPQVSAPEGMASISLRSGVNAARTMQATFESNRRPDFARPVVDVETTGSAALATRAVANAAPTDLRSLLAEKNELLTAWQAAQAQKKDKYQLLDPRVLADLMARFRDFDARAKTALEAGTGTPPEMDTIIRNMFAQLEPMKALVYDTQNVLNHIYQKKEASSSMSLAQSAALNEVASVPFYETQRLAQQPAPAGDLLAVAQRFHDLISVGLARTNAFVDAAIGKPG